MKKSSMLMFMVVSLAACTSDEVQKDLLNYVNQEMPKLTPLEDEAVAA